MPMSQREMWFDGRIVPLEQQDLWVLVNNSPIKRVVVTVEQRRNGYYPHKTEFITEIKKEEDLTMIPEGEIVFSDCQRRFTGDDIGFHKSRGGRRLHWQECIPSGRPNPVDKRNSTTAGSTERLVRHNFTITPPCW